MLELRLRDDRANTPMIEYKDGLARDSVTYVVEIVDHWEPFSIGWLEPVAFQKLRAGDKCRGEILPPDVAKRPADEDQVTKGHAISTHTFAMSTHLFAIATHAFATATRGSYFLKLHFLRQKPSTAKVSRMGTVVAQLRLGKRAQNFCAVCTGTARTASENRRRCSCLRQHAFAVKHLGLRLAISNCYDSL